MSIITTTSTTKNSIPTNNNNKLVITLQHNPIDLIQQTTSSKINEESINDVSQLIVPTIASPIPTIPKETSPTIVTQQQLQQTTQTNIIDIKKKTREDDENRLLARQKQIDIGKNTIGYQNFIIQLKYLNPKHIVRQPNIFQICSKRSFDGQCKIWRRYLHQFDPQHQSTTEINNEIQQ